MKSVRFAPLLAVLLACLGTARAQLPRTEALLKDLEGRQQFYGSVLVKRNGTVVFQGAYGSREPPYPTPRNAVDSVYYLAECSEVFCNVMAVMAVEKGLMALDAPIGAYIPAFNGKPAPRVQDLLSHASGLVGRMMHSGDKPRTKADTAAWAAEDGPAFPPGSRMAFTDVEADVLAHALERVTGRTYRELLAEWLTGPLGLKQTGLGLFPEGNPALAQIYRQADWNYWLKQYPEGSAAMDAYTSPQDLAALMEALASGRLVSKQAFALMGTARLPGSRDPNRPGNMGLGFYLTPSGALYNLGRMGGMSDETTGYHALVLYDPRNGLTVVLLANKWKPDPDGYALGLVMPAVYADLGLAP
jgi:CubicO group peptidase (beta-lactamase class C family)